MKTLGLILVVLGIVGLLWGGFSYNRKEKVLDLGELEASVTKKERVAFPPLAGGLAIVAGAALILMDRRARA